MGILVLGSSACTTVGVWPQLCCGWRVNGKVARQRGPQPWRKLCCSDWEPQVDTVSVRPCCWDCAQTLEVVGCMTDLLDSEPAAAVFSDRGSSRCSLCCHLAVGCAGACIMAVVLGSRKPAGSQQLQLLWICASSGTQFLWLYYCLRLDAVHPSLRAMLSTVHDVSVCCGSRCILPHSRPTHSTTTRAALDAAAPRPQNYCFAGVGLQNWGVGFRLCWVGHCMLLHGQSCMHTLKLVSSSTPSHFFKCATVAQE